MITLGVLEFVEDDETVGNRAATHVDDGLVFKIAIQNFADVTVETITTSRGVFHTTFVLELFGRDGEAQNFAHVIGDGFGFDHGFFDGVARNKTDFLAEGAVSWADENALIFPTLGDAVIAGGGRKKRFAGAENA